MTAKSSSPRGSASAILLLGTLAALLCSCSRSSPKDPQASPDRPPDRPNIVFITVDTLRADRLPSYGYKALQTPAIDQLARDGVRFERMIAQVPMTLPSHCSIFTGSYPTVTGVRDQAGREPEKSRDQQAWTAAHECLAKIALGALDGKCGLQSSPLHGCQLAARFFCHGQRREGPDFSTLVRNRAAANLRIRATHSACHARAARCGHSASCSAARAIIA